MITPKSDFRPFTFSIDIDTPEQATYLSCMWGDNCDAYMKHLTSAYERELGAVFPEELIRSIAAAGWQLFGKVEEAGDHDFLLKQDILYQNITKYAKEE
jgi:hypothetical protein